MEKALQTDIKRELIKLQQSEITEHLIYNNLSRREKDPEKREILRKIAAAEKKHYELLQKITKEKVGPSRLKIFFYSLVAGLLGYHFALKRMEGGEARAQLIYEKLADSNTAFNELLKEEEEHELALIELIDEERLSYLGSIVLGLNDGLVELLGTVAGLSFALKSPKLVGISALIVGVAACLSMSASEYLSASTEKDKNPTKAAFYTAFSYFAAVLAIVLPFFITHNVYFALLLSVFFVLILLTFFSYYISTVQKGSFWERFIKMAAVVFSVSVISFAVGYILRLS